MAICIEISPECYKSLEAKKSQVFDRIKNKSETLLNKELAGVTDWIVNRTLAKQKKSDFRPRSDDLELLNDVSSGCQQTVDFLRSFNQTLKRLIDNEQMVFNFLQELSNEFFLILIEHLKKFTVSDNGAVILRNDLRMYAELLGLLHDKSKVKDKQDFLSELGNIFLVKPENLKALMQEGILSLIDPKLIYNLIMQRADFKSANIETFFPEMNSTFSFGTRFFD
jgi:exocyst complex component 5